MSGHDRKTLRLLDVEHLAQQVKRHAPAAAVGRADGGGVLVDAHEHACDGAAVAILECHGVAWLKRARRGCRGGRLWRRHVRCLPVVPFGCAAALHRHARDLPSPLRALFKHGGLGVFEGNDLAAAHLPVAKVNEAHGLAQMQVSA